MSTFDQQVIREFRENEGKVGGYLEGDPMVLLTTTGAKSGKQRTSPLVYFPDEGRIFVIASNGGAPTNPNWYYNIIENPVVTAEIGTETFRARVRILEGRERDRTYARATEATPRFGTYQQGTRRLIPVVELVPIQG